ncbi:MAG TPA: hypothetical protein VFH23_08840 [Jiangellaceae bacterium]|nr:hypothetical protein [Jiangellaceae bacterium]
MDNLPTTYEQRMAAVRRQLRRQLDPQTDPERGTVDWLETCPVDTLERLAGMIGRAIADGYDRGSAELGEQ